MRLKSFSVVLFSVCASAFAQENSDTTYNTISLEFYQPFADPEFGQTYIPDWQHEMFADLGGYDIEQDFENQVDYSLFKLSGGICYERLLKNNFVIRPRIGFSSLKEYADYEVDRFPWNGLIDYRYYSAFLLKKLQLNCFLGFGKKFFISKNFSLLAGVDIPFFYKMDHSGYFNFKINGYLPGEETLHSKSNYVHEFNLGNTLSLGAGPMLVPSFTFDNSLTVSLEFQLFYLYTATLNGDAKKIISEGWLDEVFNGGYDLYNIDTDTETLDIKRTAFDWSGLSTVVRVGYSF